MAEAPINLNPPKPLSLTGNLADNFKTFKQAYNIYMTATGLSEKPAKRRGNILLHLLGEEAVKLYNGFVFEAGQEEDPAQILAKFNDYCTPKTNLTYERHKLNTRAQAPGESFDSFYTDLCNLAKTCNYGDLYNDMIKDRIVCGIVNKSLQQKLLRDTKLTLDSAIDTCRAWEATETHSATLHSNSSTADIGQISRYKGKRSSKNSQTAHCSNNHHQRGHKQCQQGQNQHQGRNQTHSRSNQRKNSCKYCGYENHDRKMCPARNSTCNLCHIPGHFARVCRKKRVGAVYDEMNSDTDTFLGMIEVDIGRIKSRDHRYDVDIRIDGKVVPYRVDTGADVTVLSVQQYNKTFSHKMLQPTQLQLRGADTKPLNCLGYFSAILAYKGKSVKEKVYVLNHGASLLSRNASENLGLIKLMIGGIFMEDLPNQYPSLFTGLGKMNMEYDIKLNQDITPYSVSTPRRIPLPLMDKVKKELDRLQKLDVIAPVDEPTDWCAPMVIVPKTNGQVRICVDLQKLNKAVKRERHMLPSVDHTLGQLANAKVFTKLDANSGFHQIPLAKSSQMLTTFITPFGRYAYQRLPFGISSGPEIFQKEVSKILEGLGVVCLMDDIVVYGTTEEEHDKKLKLTLDKLEKAGISLNKSKCEWKQKTVKFLGQQVGEDGIKADEEKVLAIKQMPVPGNVHDVRRFMGMINQLGKFAPHLASKSEPIRSLLCSGNDFVWNSAQDSARRSKK